MTNPKPPTAAVGVNGHLIRQLRKQAGIGLVDFAKQADISPAYLTNIERGRKTQVSPRVFAAICDGLNIPRDERSTLYSEAEMAAYQAVA